MVQKTGAGHSLHIVLDRREQIVTILREVTAIKLTNFCFSYGLEATALRLAESVTKRILDLWGD